jgi:hypothetical protein
MPDEMVAKQPEDAHEWIPLRFHPRIQKATTFDAGHGRTPATIAAPEEATPYSVRLNSEMERETGPSRGSTTTGQQVQVVYRLAG